MESIFEELKVFPIPAGKGSEGVNEWILVPRELLKFSVFPERSSTGMRIWMNLYMDIFDMERNKTIRTKWSMELKCR